MSLDWVERDLTEWAKKTLPEFLLISMQDPDNKDECIARTPWQSYVVCVAEVQIDGEASLTGKKSHSLFQFELDIGIRLDIEREGKDDYWPGVVQMVHFDNINVAPPIIARMEELPGHVADEVSWYVREGMGRRYLWHGLARWHAYAVKKWTKSEPPPVIDPYRDPETPPEKPPFARKLPPAASEEEKPTSMQRGGASSSSARPGVPYIGRKSVLELEGSWASPPASDDEGDALGDGGLPRRFGRYPYLPSVLAGVGGPSTSGLRPRGHAVEHPEWFCGKSPGDELALTSADVALNKARKRATDLDVASPERQLQLRAAELCDAIETGDIMKVFAKLDDETVNCAHPGTGLLPVHYCVSKGAKELLQMMIEGKADLNKKDGSGQTALMAAAKSGNAELSKLLLDCGADPAEQDVFGRSAAEMVKVEPVEDRPIKDWREKLSGVKAPPEAPKTRSHELRDLIDARERPKKYGALLLDAIQQKDHRTAEAAVEAGGDVNATDAKGETPLLLLAKGKWKDNVGVQVRLAQKVCKAGAMVNATNTQGSAPLHFAAHRGNEVLVDALLAMRADPTTTNGEGNTPLMYAAHGGHELICTALLEAFSPVTAKNKFGLTAEDTALRRGFKSCAVLIQAYVLAPKRADADSSALSAKKKERKKDAAAAAFDYSKWNALEKEMQEEEDFEEATRQRELQAAAKRPVPKLENLGPEAFGLPPGTPWPPEDPAFAKKGPFDYGRWDRIVDDIERRDRVKDRYEHLQKNPQYEWRDGQKLQVII